MNLLNLIFLVLCAINYVHASKNKYYSTCEIEGLNTARSSKEDYHYLKNVILDTFDGEIIRFQTKNIQRIKSSVDYLNVTLNNSELIFSTSNTFKYFEKNSGISGKPEISVKLEMDCAKTEKYKGKEQITKMYIYQKVEDTNNHPPTFSQEYYNYSFGMPIPKGISITDILPIVATDYDMTNYRVKFSIDKTENFIIDDRTGRSKDKDKYYSKHHEVNLIANKDLTAPFDQTIIITATDEGKPPISTSVPITITINNPKDLEEIVSSNKNYKSPIFSKPVYFADYTLKNEILMEEIITLEYAANINTLIIQNGYEEYFNVQFGDSHCKDVNIKQITNLPEEILNHFDTIAIEIEATLDFQTTSFTTLIIRLPKLGSKIIKENSPDISEPKATQECNASFQKDYIMRGYSIPLILFAISVCCLIFINTYMIIIFLNKTKKEVQINKI